MALFSKKNLKCNPFGLTEEDITGDLSKRSIPMGVVVRMLEEQELQGNKPDVKVFSIDICTNSYRGGFDWEDTEAKYIFWCSVMIKLDFRLFFERYPDYEIYNLI